MKALNLSPALYEYLIQVSPVEDPYLKELRLKTDKLKYARLRSPTEQIYFMMFMLRFLKPKRILEVGTFTGYSTLAIALACGTGSEIITCDINNIFPEVGREIWEKANVLDRISLRLGHAINTLESLVNENSRFDFVFIDADKENYIQYFDKALSMLTENGMIMVDNVLWRGEITDLQTSDMRAQAIREFNRHLAEKNGVNYCLLPIGDGITLISKN